MSVAPGLLHYESIFERGAPSPCTQPRRIWRCPKGIGKQASLARDDERGLDFPRARWSHALTSTTDPSAKGDDMRTSVAAILLRPLFEIPARHSEWIETRIRANHSGMAEFLCSGALRTK